jgi:DNA-binding helix-hairpin-helix protein with protein kinase domain
MNMNRSVDVSQLSIGELLDRGGQGEVWSLMDRPDEVFKKYLLPSINAAPLHRLVAFPDQLTTGDQQVLLSCTAWPTCVVTEAGRETGFLMRRVPKEFVATMTSGKAQLRELQYLLFAPKPLWGDIVPLDGDGRVELIRRFVEVLQILHRHQMVLGDISMRNILWSEGQRPGVMVLDCDSAKEEARPGVSPDVNTPDWADPEGRTDLASDRYKLALLVARVLACDPYVKPGNPPVFLPDVEPQIGIAVAETFARAGGPRDARPDADSWARALSGRATIQLTPPVQRLPLPQLPMADLDQRGERGVINLRPVPGRP